MLVAVQFGNDRIGAEYVVSIRHRAGSAVLINHNGVGTGTGQDLARIPYVIFGIFLEIASRAPPKHNVDGVIS